MKKNIFKKEYQKFAFLTIISLITGIIEFVGFAHTESHALGIAVTHMIFHVSFFGTLCVFALFYQKTAQELRKRTERIISALTIGLVVIFGVFRVNELLEQAPASMQVGELGIFRFFLVTVIALIALQWYVLHMKTTDEVQSCGALCHGSKGHLLVDCIGFIALLTVTFIGSYLTAIVDQLVFVLSALVIIWTVVGIVRKTR